MNLLIFMLQRFVFLLELVDIYVLLIVQLLEAFVGLPLSSQLGT